jgi:phosphoribosylformylglycinamidine cyclo-ligase
VLKEIIEGTASFFEMLQKYEINCHFLGGETADLGDITQTMTTDGTMTTRMLQKNIINNGNIQAGQVIVGLASYGQAIYENEYNSGIGSNGLTSARHDLLSKKYATLYPESFDSNTNQNVLYCGKYSVTDQLPNLPLNIGKMVLSPTRTFSPVIKNILNNCGDKIRGLVHCTGGGQTKVLHYIQNVDIVKNNLLPISDFFQLIKNESNVSWQEMYKVYTDETTASEVIQIANSFGIDAQIIGYTSTQKESKPRVIIQNNGEEIVY